MGYKKIVELNYVDNSTNTLPKDSVQYRCRFCGETKTKADFKMKAHAVAECIGNKTIVSTYECDECNKKFSENEEDELGKLWKLYKSSRGLNGKKGPTKLNTGISMSNDSTGFSLNIKDTTNLKNKFKLTLLENDIMKIEVNNPTKINSMLIYRSYLKFALSVVPEDVSKELETGYKILRNEVSITVAQGYGICYKAMIKKPKIKIYKLNSDSNIPKYLCEIDIYQIKVIIFLDFDNDCNFIPIECIAKDLEIDLNDDNIHEIIICKFTDTDKVLPLKEEVTGKIKK